MKGVVLVNRAEARWPAVDDLIETAAQQTEMADMIAGWVAEAFARTNAKGFVKCVA